MGSGTAETLREIDEIRAKLGEKIAELEKRMPDVARRGKRLVGLIVGGGAGGGALLFAIRRLRKRGRRALPSASGSPTVTVNVLPKGTGALALAIALVWGGVRLAEVKLRSGMRPPEKKAELRSIPGERHA